MPEKAIKTEKTSTWVVLSLELGFLIAIPAVIGAFGGRYIDRHFNTSPLFLLSGILASIAVATAGLVMRIKRFTAMIEEQEKSSKKASNIDTEE